MESNILIIVEGLKTEPNFFNRLSDVFGLNLISIALKRIFIRFIKR